jgi:hypothetical protein
MDQVSVFLSALFDENESICVSDSVYGTEVTALAQVRTKAELPQYFAINPLRESRSDRNCAVLRNFLVEFDTIALEEQVKLIDSLKMPFTTMVYSGGKSYHYILALDQPIATEQEYRKLARWIYAVLAQKNKADESCKNPSRLSRMAGARRDNGALQALIQVQGRIPVTDLGAWLSASGVAEPMVKEFSKFDQFRPVKNLSGLTRRTRIFLESGAPVGSRHHSLFAATCNMYRCGFSEKEILQQAKNVLDFGELPRFYRCVSDAIKTAIQDSQS